MGWYVPLAGLALLLMISAGAYVTVQLLFAPLLRGVRARSPLSVMCRGSAIFFIGWCLLLAAGLMRGAD